MFGFLGKGSPFEIRYCELRLTHEFVSDHSLYNSAPKLRAYKAKKEKETIQIQSGGAFAQPQPSAWPELTRLGK